MAGNPPVELKVEQVVSEETGGFGDVLILEEVELEGEGRTRPFWFSEGTDPPQAGETVKGWWNTTKSGKNPGTRYFRRADDKAPQRSTNGAQTTLRDDATGRSIERQVAAKIAGDILAPHYEGLSEDVFAKAFRQITDTVHTAIRGE